MGLVSLVYWLVFIRYVVHVADAVVVAVFSNEWSLLLWRLLLSMQVIDQNHLVLKNLPLQRFERTIMTLGRAFLHNFLLLALLCWK